MAWDVIRYLGFGQQRLRPAVDLIARIPLSAPASILDLGCGPGTVTRLLQERWPAASICGIDSSASMLERARASLSTINWIEADVARFSPEEPVDLVFSNAALHWLGNHRELFGRLRAWVRPGGVLAVQMPDNFAAPSHRIVATTAAQARYAALLGDARMGAVDPPEDYFRLLSRLGGEVDLWTSEYVQALSGPDPVLDWLRGTTLVPYIAALGPAADEFLSELGPALRYAYPPGPDGVTLFPFRRLFVVARF